MEAWQERLADWQVATRKLAKQFPKVADLDPEFFDTVVESPKPMRRAQSAMLRQTAATTERETKPKGRTWPKSVAIFLGLMLLSSISRWAREPAANSPFLTPQQRQQQMQQQQRQPPVWTPPQMAPPQLQLPAEDNAPPEPQPTEPNDQEDLQQPAKDPPPAEPAPTEETPTDPAPDAAPNERPLSIHCRKF